jgi:hypothetical protein
VKETHDVGFGKRRGLARHLASFRLARIRQPDAFARHFDDQQVTQMCEEVAAEIA